MEYTVSKLLLTDWIREGAGGGAGGAIAPPIFSKNSTVTMMLWEI